MSTINILPPLLANQIAAGEVVERPASVVKELLENSIDAGATKIELSIEKGGLQKISITDDGIGIHKNELPLALARHATSKINTLTDLMHISSLGFRGEALASISSVSRVLLSSKPQDQTEAWQIYAAFDQTEPNLKPCAHPNGTTIEVAELFFNTPARRKFMRSEQTEFIHLEEVVRRIALSHFNIGFILKHHDKLIWQTPVAQTTLSQEQRLKTLLGQTFLNNCVAIDIERNGLILKGWLGLPTHSRSQKDQQYFYVNGRMVRDKIISHAINQSYQDVRYGNRHPVFVLYFSCDPEWVDVNVHPTKHEVRFREARCVHDFIYYAIHKTIANLNAEYLNTTETHIATDLNVIPTQLSSPTPAVPQQNQRYQAYRPEQQSTLKIQEQISGYQQLHPPVETTEDLTITPILGYAIGQLHNTFILAQNAQGLVIIDIHAAHERIVYEQMKKNIEQNQFNTQRLLLPLVVKLSPKEAETAENHQTEFLAMGFELDRFSHDSIRIITVPIALAQVNHERLLRDILADLHMRGLSHRLSNLLMEKLGNIACKQAIKANHTLSIVEMNALLRTMEKTPRYGQCNHGRPTLHYLSLEEVGKLFLRGR